MINLSRRQRQIMDILFRCGDSTAQEIQKQLPDPPSNSAVRAMLKTMVDKGYLKQRAKDFRYVYSAAMRQETAQQTALDRLVNTFLADHPPLPQAPYSACSQNRYPPKNSMS